MLFTGIKTAMEKAGCAPLVCLNVGQTHTRLFEGNTGNAI